MVEVQPWFITIWLQIYKKKQYHQNKSGFILVHKGVRHLCDVRYLTPGEALPHVEEDLAAVARRYHHWDIYCLLTPVS